MNGTTEIILIEDSISEADLIVRALRKSNFANPVIHFMDGREALNYFTDYQHAGKVAGETPKVILLDLNIPIVNGIGVLQKIKSNDRTKFIPVIVLTSSKDNPDIEKCYQLGINSYVVKPIAFDELMTTVSKLGLYWLTVNKHLK